MRKFLFGTGCRALPVLALLACCGCGRKATVQDCEKIVQRVAELELATLAPGRDTSEEVRNTQVALRGRALEKCVGRRISEDALNCVQAAKSAEEIIDECFD